MTDAFLKFHAIVLVMRLYEYVASKIVDKITLDALTIDTFKTAKRIDSNENDRSEVGKQMFSVCLSGNLIAFLADYSVHQLILGYGYYSHIRARRKRRQERIEKEGSSQDSERDGEEDEEGHPILKQSTSLMLSRSLGLVCTACGGAVGSMLMPGWGTLLGSNMGDSVGGLVSENPTFLADAKAK